MFSISVLSVKYKSSSFILKSVEYSFSSFSIDFFLLLSVYCLFSLIINVSSLFMEFKFIWFFSIFLLVLLVCWFFLYFSSKEAEFVSISIISGVLSFVGLSKNSSSSWLMFLEWENSHLFSSKFIFLLLASMLSSLNCFNHSCLRSHCLFLTTGGAPYRVLPNEGKPRDKDPFPKKP